MLMFTNLHSAAVGQPMHFLLLCSIVASPVHNTWSATHSHGSPCADERLISEVVAKL